MQSFDPSAERVKKLLETVRELGGHLPRLGDELIAHRNTADFLVKEKSDGSEVTTGDLLADQRLKTLIARIMPGIPIISEEDGDASVVIPDRCLLLDPIDGTSSYIRGDEFAVQLAKIEQGQVEAGMIYFPLTCQLLYSVQGVGVFLSENGSSEIQITRPSNLSFDPTKISLPHDLKSKLPESISVPFREGWLAMLKGEIHGKVGGGRGFAWDLRPWEGVFAVHGGVARSFDGGPLVFRSAADTHRAVWAVNGEVMQELVRRL